MSDNTPLITPRTLKVPITNVYAMGGYCAQLRFGANKTPANLIIDTGSSTLVVSDSDYDDEQDTSLVATSFAQEVLYGAGGWDGPVVHTRVGLREEDIDFNLSDGYQLEPNPDAHAPIVLNDCPVAIVSSIKQEGTFLHADGILGLAYHQLNKSYNLKHYFDKYQITPALTYPWPFDDEISICSNDYHAHLNANQIENQVENKAAHSEQDCDNRFTSDDLRQFKAFLKQQPTQDIIPYFTELTQHGLTANKFAFYSRRSSVHFSTDISAATFSAKKSADKAEKVDKAAQQAHFAQLNQDSLNQGWLIIGGGEEHIELYQGEFTTISVVEDKYYNVNLISIQVGDQTEIDSLLTEEIENSLEPAESIERDDSLDPDNSLELNESPEPVNSLEPIESPEHLASQVSHDHALLSAIGMNKQLRGRSNAIIDTGVSGIVFTKHLYSAMVEHFSALNPKFAALIKPFSDIAMQYQGIDMSQLNLDEWPTLTLHFVGERNHHSQHTHNSGDNRCDHSSKNTSKNTNKNSCDHSRKNSSINSCDNKQYSPEKVSIHIKPEHYWQTNTPAKGKACFKILSQLAGWPNQSLLGLPLMNDHYVIFDRSAHQTGVIHFAKQR
ncbi:pepsin-like aspartyl protease [Shewanella marinintestina]|uniref:pepsin-like aspartyl protease n=1 Tax=Shewanella marinintestina TaxID=190305 RepID=UPI00200BF1D4|nr:pepsin-like aspartyl protease [Shewanella marinintestina]MCL1146788.1 pepsin-like aspartyl protease [Shewanella marinintestina]